MSLFFTQGHRGICSKTRLIPGPTGPRGDSASYENIILECKTGGDVISSAPLQSLKIGTAYIFLRSHSRLVFNDSPNGEFSILFKSNFNASSLSFSLLDTMTDTDYELLETKVEANLFTFNFTNSNKNYILHVNGSAFYNI